MQVEVYEWEDDDEGGHFKMHLEERDYSKTADRHCDTCIVCGYPTYPECCSWCHNMKILEMRKDEPFIKASIHGEIPKMPKKD